MKRPLVTAHPLNHTSIFHWFPWKDRIELLSAVLISDTSANTCNKHAAYACNDYITGASVIVQDNKKQMTEKRNVNTH